MATIISHNIISPLGLTSVDNYNAIFAGESAIATYPGLHKDMRPYSASLIAREVYDELIIDGYSKYESLVIQSIKRSLYGVDLNVSSSDICLILSTTKGNIEELDLTESQNVSPAVTAQRIADYFFIPYHLQFIFQQFDYCNFKILPWKSLHQGQITYHHYLIR